MNVNNNAIKRIMADVRELAKHPSPRYSAAPLEDNIFEWHFSIRGPSGTDFEGGTYHGRILLPSEYPFKPPNIIFLTKTGRFEVGTKICLSISAYHEESWQPAWGVRTMLEAIISFLPSEGAGSIGSLEYSKSERQKLAKESLTYSCPCCGPIAALLSEIDDKEVVDKEVAGQISQLHIAGSSYSNKTPTAPPALAPASVPSSGTATSANNGLEGKESGDATFTSGASSTVDAAYAITNTHTQTHTATAPSPAMILKDTAPQHSSSSKIESSNAGVKGAGLLTGFDGADIDDFVQRRSAEAASNGDEERNVKVQVQEQVQPQLVDVAVHADMSINASGGASSGAESVSTSAQACPTCGVDKKTVVPVIDRSAAMKTASSSDSTVTAASSSQSYGITATTASVRSDQDSTTDGKEDRTVSLSGSQVTENISAVSTSTTEGTMGQNPPDVTDTILSASLYIIGTLICAIVVRRLIILFLLARSHIPDNDRGDL